MGKALTTIKDELNNSPMYNLSLSSKELFHSNLFAWLGNTMETKRFFIEMIKELTKTKNDSGIELGSIKNWSVEREEKNFDLCIKSGDDYLLIIENKVKSIPRKDQLDEYEEKIKKHYKKADKYPTRFLLLTLANEFPHKKDINDEKKWKIKTYADLSDAMNNNIGLLLEQYHKSLIQDYSNFIRNMDLLVKIWQNNENFACTTDLDGLNKLSDLHEKIQFSYYSIRLKDLLIRSIKDVVVFDNKDKKDKRFAKKVDEKENKLYIMVDWDIANYSKRGLVDIEIPITDLNMPKIQLDCCNPKYVIKIQVEGRSYRHVLQILDKYTLRTTTNLADIGKKDKYTTVH